MTPLPPALSAALGAVADRAPSGAERDHRNEAFAETVQEALDRVGRIPAANFERRAGAIRDGARLWGGSRCDLDLLTLYPELAPLYLFHGYGYCREAALHRLWLGPDPSFFHAALFYGLNDWVPEVRGAAQAACARLLPDVSERAFFALVPTVPLNMRSWRRSGPAETVLDHWWSQPSARAASLRWLETTPTGPARAILATALPQVWIDPHLPKLFARSKHPAIREAIAGFLLSGQVTWTTGHGRAWVDKSLGVSRRISVVRERPLAIAADPLAIAQQVARDPSAKVRRVAADWLIREGRSGGGEQVAEHLASDTDAGVLARMAFFERKRRD